MILCMTQHSKLLKTLNRPAEERAERASGAFLPKRTTSMRICSRRYGAPKICWIGKVRYFEHFRQGGTRGFETVLYCLVDRCWALWFCWKIENIVVCMHLREMRTNYSSQCVQIVKGVIMVYRNFLGGFGFFFFSFILPIWSFLVWFLSSFRKVISRVIVLSMKPMNVIFIKTHHNHSLKSQPLPLWFDIWSI